MASSGSFSGSIRDGHYKLRVDWSQSKNVSVNTSTVTCKLYLVNDWSLNISGRSDNTCTIDGSAQTFSSPAISTTGTHLLGTVSRTVNHASDGSKSLTISAVFQIRATLSGTYYGTISASANITLDSIPRASSVSATNMGLPVRLRSAGHLLRLPIRLPIPLAIPVGRLQPRQRQLLYHGRQLFHWPARSRMRPAVPARSPVRLITGIRTSVPRPAH